MGAAISFKPEDERYCIGRYDLYTFESMPCPLVSKLTDSKTKICPACFQFNGFNPSFYNVSVSQLTKKQRDYNLAPHNVYLAYFNGKVVKVGISHHKRVLTRLNEQGALAAMIILEVENAYRAREIEEKIVRNALISEVLNKKEKRQLLCKPFDFAEATACLNQAAKTVSTLTGQDHTGTPVLNFYTEYTGHPLLFRDIIDLTEEENIVVSGEPEGLIGDVLIFKNKEKRYMLSLQNILGRKISFLRQIETISHRPIQQSLF
jgi:hypothetical protein